jgi:hypothetical protein
MRPANGASSLAAPQRTGVAGFLLDLKDHVREVYLLATSRESVRTRLHKHGRDHQIDKARSKEWTHTSALAQLFGQLERIHAAGATYAELTAFASAVQNHVNLLAGRAPRSLDKLDLDEERVSAQEDVAQMGRRIQMLRGELAIEQLEIERGFRLERSGLDLEFVQAIDLKISEIKRVGPQLRVAAGVA